MTTLEYVGLGCLGVIAFLFIGFCGFGFLFEDQIDRAVYLFRQWYARKYRMPTTRATIINLMKEQGVTAFGFACYYSIPIRGGVKDEIGWRINGGPVQTLLWHDNYDTFLEFIAANAIVPTKVIYYDRGDERDTKIIEPLAS